MDDNRISIEYFEKDGTFFGREAPASNYGRMQSPTLIPAPGLIGPAGSTEGLTMGPHRSVTNRRGRLSEIVFDPASSTFGAELLPHPFLGSIDEALEGAAEIPPCAAPGDTPDGNRPCAPAGVEAILAAR